MKTFRTFGQKREIPNQQPQYSDQREDYQGTDDYNQNFPQTKNVKEFEPNYNSNERTNFDYDEEGEQLNYEEQAEEFVPTTMYSNMQNIHQINDQVSEKHVKINDQNENKVLPIAERIKQEFHFQTKIKNSGFWGKVYLRKGTWMVIVGFCLFIISTVLIGVFWGFWYSNALNYPMRILAITLLSTGLSMTVLGLISNYLMFLNRENKDILGSPLRLSTKILILCSILLIIASDCITFYYTYWASRWVNTPFIIVAIVLYFFAGLGFLFAMRHIIELYLVHQGLLKKREKRRERLERQERKRKERLQRIMSSDSFGKVSKISSKRSWDILLAEEQNLSTINESEMDQSVNKRNFRGQVIKLTPKPVILISNVTSANTTTQIEHE